MGLYIYYKKILWVISMLVIQLISLGFLSFHLFVHYMPIIGPFIRRKMGRVEVWDLAWILSVIFNCKIYKQEGELYEDKCLYLMNHTGFSDFFLDTCITKGGAYLGRMTVFWSVPFACISNLISQGIIFFRRGQSRKEELNAQLDRWYYKHPKGGVIVYPQATRLAARWNKTTEIKTGMVRYAFLRNLPIQIIMASNKEKILAEKDGLSASYGIDVPVFFGPIYYPRDYKDCDEWVNVIKEEWSTFMARFDTDIPISFSSPIKTNSDFLGLKIIISASFLYNWLKFTIALPLISILSTFFLVLCFGLYILSDSYNSSSPPSKVKPDDKDQKN